MKMKKNAEKQKAKIDRKTLIILALAAILLAAGISVYFTEYVKDIEIPDRCGVFVNKVVHTIESSSVCEVRCLSQCETIDYRMISHKFKEASVGCHTCTCRCIRTFI